MAPGQKDQWIRVPRSRRKKTISGAENMVGVAASGGEIGERPLDPKDLPEGEPEMEIESLIIPAVEQLHTSHIEKSKNRR